MLIIPITIMIAIAIILAVIWRLRVYVPETFISLKSNIQDFNTNLVPTRLCNKHIAVNDSIGTVHQKFNIDWKYPYYLIDNNLFDVIHQITDKYGNWTDGRVTKSDLKPLSAEVPGDKDIIRRVIDQINYRIIGTPTIDVVDVIDSKPVEWTSRKTGSAGSQGTPGTTDTSQGIHVLLKKKYKWLAGRPVLVDDNQDTARIFNLLINKTKTSYGLLDVDYGQVAMPSSPELLSDRFYLAHIPKPIPTPSESIDKYLAIEQTHRQSINHLLRSYPISG